MNKDIMQRMLELMPSDTGMDLPPRVFTDMEGEFIDLVEGISLTARFPNKDCYMNPMGFMQGGILTAAIDNTVSPSVLCWVHRMSLKPLARLLNAPLKKRIALLL